MDAKAIFIYVTTDLSKAYDELYIVNNISFIVIISISNQTHNHHHLSYSYAIGIQTTRTKTFNIHFRSPEVLFLSKHGKWKLQPDFQKLY